MGGIFCEAKKGGKKLQRAKEEKMESSKVALITGGANGIGKVVAHRMLLGGYRVAISDVDKEALKDFGRLHSSAALLCINADVTINSDVLEMIDKILRVWGRLDILVNNAGGGSSVPWFVMRQRKPYPTVSIRVEDCDLRMWEKGLSLNLKSCFLCSKAAIPHLINQKGCMVNVASMAARFGAILGGADYASSKASVLGLTRRLARELGPFGVRCNVVAPGFTLSPRLERVWAGKCVSEREKILSQIPLGRFATPEEQANAIVFLCSEKSSYLTGVILDVNGGFCFT